MTSSIKITCPGCGFSRDVPTTALPAGTVRVTCPNCREAFVWERPSSEAIAQAEPAGLSDDGHQKEFAVTPDPAKPDNSPSAGMLTIGDLFSQSWELYQKRIPTLLALMLATLILLMIPVGIFLGIGYLCSIPLPELKTPLLIAGGITGGTIGAITMTWGMVAFVCAVADTQLNAGLALEQGWRNFLPMAWVFAIIGFIISGGYFLLVIPGIIFSVLFAFSQFICISEGERGMAAVIKSRRYVKGYGGEVFARMLVIWISSGVAGMVPFIGSIFSILFIPFVSIYTFLLYQDLRRLKGDVSGPVTQEEKYLWLGLPLLGYLIFPLIFLAIFGAALIGIFSQFLAL